MKYLHLTKKGQEDAYRIINTVIDAGFQMTVRNIFQAYGMAYLSKYADTIPF